MIGDILNNILTLYPLIDTLYLPCKSKVGIGISHKGDKSPLPLTVFLRPHFTINTGLIRVKSVMTDCMRETVKSLARSFAGMPTLCSLSPMIGIVDGGTPSFKGITAMLETQAQTEQAPNNPLNVDFSHPLNTAVAELSHRIALVDAVNLMACKAISLLDTLSPQFLKEETHLNIIESAIAEIRDINAVVNAYHQELNALNLKAIKNHAL